ncbi:hypothetical protein BU26DRAFT_149537 [Trematosphaeria pertusa]|uniref:Uncharacterized protein n=1 Tax=Trematosphaeria pertusa TaxID=390896 RepID=A0A6A6IWS3_9PLEO|nr:uncharacterized protein BU26DRAFT_149537 [Trematosphaeria pertusa]KAF2255005.1 hypothetical protein BU26DRAFT_149537 [Trematosphaeria pertusa]
MRMRARMLSMASCVNSWTPAYRPGSNVAEFVAACRPSSPSKAKAGKDRQPRRGCGFFVALSVVLCGPSLDEDAREGTKTADHGPLIAEKGTHGIKLIGGCGNHVRKNVARTWGCMRQNRRIADAQLRPALWLFGDGLHRWKFTKSPCAGV